MEEQQKRSQSRKGKIRGKDYVGSIFSPHHSDMSPLLQGRNKRGGEGAGCHGGGDFTTWKAGVEKACPLPSPHDSTPEKQARMSIAEITASLLEEPATAD